MVWLAFEQRSRQRCFLQTSVDKFFSSPKRMAVVYVVHACTVIVERWFAGFATRWSGRNSISVCLWFDYTNCFHAKTTFGDASLRKGNIADSPKNNFMGYRIYTNATSPDTRTTRNGGPTAWFVITHWSSYLVV